MLHASTGVTQRPATTSPCQGKETIWSQNSTGTQHGWKRKGTRCIALGSGIVKPCELGSGSTGKPRIRAKPTDTLRCHRSPLEGGAGSSSGQRSLFPAKHRVASVGSPSINPPRWRDSSHLPPPLESRWKFLWALLTWGEAPLALRPSRCRVVRPNGICLGFGSWSRCECTRAGKGLLSRAGGAGGCRGIKDVGAHGQPPAHGGRFLICSCLPTKNDCQGSCLALRQARSPVPPVSEAAPRPVSLHCPFVGPHAERKP